MRAIILHNPSAGNGDTAAEDLLAALAAGGLTARYCSTKAPEFADALREPADLAIVAGGDGTVVKVVDHLRGRSTPIAILPLGGANNIARSFGIEGDPIEMARAGWRQTEVRRLDVGMVSGPWGERVFVEAVGVGILAEAAATIHERDVQGPEKSRLAREALHEMVACAEPQGMRFVIDRKEVEIQFLLAEIMNTTSIGPRLSLAPAARPGDGLLDLVWLEAEARAGMLAWLETASQDAPPLRARKARTVAFEWRQGRLHVDDAFFTPPARPCTIEVALLPDPITVVMPASVGLRR